MTPAEQFLLGSTSNNILWVCGAWAFVGLTVGYVIGRVAFQKYPLPPGKRHDWAGPIAMLGYGCGLLAMAYAFLFVIRPIRVQQSFFSEYKKSIYYGAGGVVFLGYSCYQIYKKRLQFRLLHLFLVITFFAGVCGASKWFDPISIGASICMSFAGGLIGYKLASKFMKREEE